MKARFSLVSMAIMVAALVAGSNGQVKVVEAASTRSVVVTITPQGDSPLQIEVGPSRRAPIIVTVRMQNTGDKPVRAYVLAVDAGNKKLTYTSVMPQRPIDPGKFVNQGIGSRGADNISIVVDHVLFTDGGTWGSDTFGRSKIAAAYIEGHDLAMTRLGELLADTDSPADFLAPLKVFGSYTLSGTVAADRPGLVAAQRLKGYRSVIAALRRVQKRTAEAQEYARKLELMEPSVSQ